MIIHRRAYRALGALIAASFAAGLCTGCQVDSAAAAVGDTCTSLVALDSAAVPADLTVSWGEEDEDKTKTFNHEQLVLAATIVKVGSDLGLDRDDIVTGVAAAIARSTLRNLDSDDDDADGGLGLFRVGSDWGSEDERKDPETAAGKFFEKLQSVQDRDDMDPGELVHKVMGDHDDEYYMQYMDPAYDIVDAVATEGPCAVADDFTWTGPIDDGCLAGSEHIRWPTVSISGTMRVSIPGSISGYVPQQYLRQIPWEVVGTYLRCDAAAAMIRLNAAFRARFGYNLRMPGGKAYRSYAGQVAAKARSGKMAATPGKSNHGWGLAADLNVPSFGSVQYQWLCQNAPLYGWNHPRWARKNGSLPEYWHWEYIKTSAGPRCA